ncbi:MAG: 8-amino-7-oxononanoate synthase [Rhodanobacteraceae bacterium]
MSRPDLLRQLAMRTGQRGSEGLLRRLRTVDRVRGARVVIDGRELLNFSGNDYLGLAQHPVLIAALKNAADETGVGSTSAHLICGHRREHAQLEEALADWTGRERALLFSSGWLANLGALSALLDRDSICVQDKLNHASLLDAVRLSGCTLKRYPHGNVGGAAWQLASADDLAALLVTDGVFSMDGDVAPLRELAALCARERATLMIDDAHGLGVLGADGAGSLAEAGLTQYDAPVLMATLGKALGCSGAFVAGSAALIDGLTQFARSFVYTTALPPALAAAARAAVKLAREESWRRDKLRALIARFRTGAAQLRLPLAESRTPIQPIVLGDSASTVAASTALETRGLLVAAIRPPSVSQGKSRLRVTLSAAHEEADIDRLLEAMEQINTIPTQPSP